MDACRPENVVETEEDIVWLFKHYIRPTVICGWCDEVQQPRTRSAKKTLEWFHSHECKDL